MAREIAPRKPATVLDDAGPVRHPAISLGGPAVEQTDEGHVGHLEREPDDHERS